LNVFHDDVELINVDHVEVKCPSDSVVISPWRYGFLDVLDTCVHAEDVAPHEDKSVCAHCVDVDSKEDVGSEPESLPPGPLYPGQVRSSV